MTQFNSRGQRTGAHTGTYKGKPSITNSYSSGRRDTFWGGQGAPIGKNHGHSVRTSNGFPIYHRPPGPRKTTPAWDLGRLLFGPPPKKRR